MVGIESNAALARYATAKLVPWTDVEIIHGDILDNIVEDATLFYLYSPFDRETTKRFRDRLVETISGTRSITLAYYNCEWVDVFRHSSQWEVEERDLSEGSGFLDGLLHRLAIIRLILRFAIHVWISLDPVRHTAPAGE